jgi:hypothetical protein
VNCKLKLFGYTYSITFTRKYCGAISICNKPRAGEDWLRGSDLRDGPLWRAPLVFWDIACHQLHIGRWRRPWGAVSA